MTNNLEDLKSRFLEYIEIEKGRSLKTVTNYDRYITRFLEFAATATKKDLKKMNADDLDEKILREYRLFLNRQLTNPRLTRGQKGFGESLKKRTQNYYMIALRSYFKFLAKNKIQTVGADQIELAKVGERELDLITGKELGAILAVMVYFFRDLWPLHSDKTLNKRSLSIWSKTLIGVLPALALGAIFASFIKEKLFNPYVVATSLLVGGLIIIFVEHKNIRSRE